MMHDPTPLLLTLGPAPGATAPGTLPKPAFQEPKLAFIEPKLTPRGDLREVTAGSFGEFSP